MDLPDAPKQFSMLCAAHRYEARKAFQSGVEDRQGFGGCPTTCAASLVQCVFHRGRKSKCFPAVRSRAQTGCRTT
eukprot:scaffold169616_cov23-Tisochrysis_lutea.AAC.2